MTITIPNYQIETQEPTLIQIDTKLYIESMKSHDKRVLVRNTMHGLTLIFEGIKELEFNGKSFEIGKDRAILFAQGNYFSNKNSKDYQSLTIFFDDTFIVGFLQKYKIELNDNTQRVIVKDYGNQEKIKLLISAILLTHREYKSHQKSLLKLQIELLFLEFYQTYPQDLERFFQHIMKTSKERMRYILEENIDIIEKVSDMYQLMRMSSSHFQKEFQKNFNESPKVWLDKQRMKKAKFLLSSTTKSITVIATECGYSTSSWFIVQFKKYYKTTPKEYRVKNQYK